jgi:hypothetical protein
VAELGVTLGAFQNTLLEVLCQYHVSYPFNRSLWIFQ